MDSGAIINLIPATRRVRELGGKEDVWRVYRSQG